MIGFRRCFNNVIFLVFLFSFYYFSIIVQVKWLCCLYNYWCCCYVVDWCIGYDVVGFLVCFYRCSVAVGYCLLVFGTLYVVLLVWLSRGCFVVDESTLIVYDCVAIWLLCMVVVVNWCHWHLNTLGCVAFCMNTPLYNPSSWNETWGTEIQHRLLFSMIYVLRIVVYNIPSWNDYQSIETSVLQIVAYSKKMWPIEIHGTGSPNYSVQYTIMERHTGHNNIT